MDTTNTSLGITEMSFRAFRKHYKGDEGVVFLGCGGDLKDWLFGIFDLWKKEKFISKNCEIEGVFEAAVALKTTGGRTDLALVFKRKPSAPVSTSKVSMWRLMYGDCSWVSDYFINYAKQHKR